MAIILIIIGIIANLTLLIYAGSVVADMAVCVQDPKGGRFAETPRVVSSRES